MSIIEGLSKDTQVATIKTSAGQYKLTVLTPEIIRVQVRPEQDQHSFAIEGDKKQQVTVTVSETATTASLQTSALTVTVDQQGYLDVYRADGTPLIMDYRGRRTPLSGTGTAAQWALMAAEGHKLPDRLAEQTREVIKVLHPDEHFYGLGDKTGFLDKRGYAYDNWNKDEPSQIEETSNMYKTVPFVIGLNGKDAYGLFFDNPYKSHFDLGKESRDYYYYAVDGGELNYYVIAGAHMTDVVSNYAYLTGHTPLPQKWTLGYQQSRDSYDSEEQVRELTTKFRELNVPCDVVHLDIGYMNGYRLFTVDPKKFPDMHKLLHDIKDQGFKTVMITDPGVKAESGYSIFDEGKKRGVFATTPAGDLYVNKVWPGDGVFPDFGRPKTRAWWADNQKILLDMGVSGVWNDMNEPATLGGDIPEDTVFYDEAQPATILQMHNVYGHNMDRATYAGLKKYTNKRPFVITRAVYSGTQKYAVVWTGDNRSSWNHLQMIVPQLCNLGLSGFGFAGTDIGGFLADATGELLVRWVQAALFSPLFRNHSCVGTRRQEPWQFDDQTLAIYRHYVQLRYCLIDYLYDLFAKGEKTGLPIMRPLVLQFSDDPNVKNLNDEYMAGDDILVAPVLTPGTTQRLIYLPRGRWLDFNTGKVYAGETYISYHAPLAVLPMFVKAGTVLPIRKVTAYVDVAKETEITFRLWGDAGKYVHYQDDGESFDYQQGAYNLYEVVFDHDQMNVRLTKHGYAPVYQSITLDSKSGQRVLHYDQASETYR